jgi:hypothetical protein
MGIGLKSKVQACTTARYGDVAFASYAAIETARVAPRGILVT